MHIGQAVCAGSREGPGSNHGSRGAYGEGAVLALDRNVLGIEFPSFHKFGERFSDRCLGCNGIGSNYLNPAELCPLGSSMIAIQYSSAALLGHPLIHTIT